MSVYDEIQAERRRQDGRWGGPKHDDQHDPVRWIALIDEYVSKAEANDGGEGYRGRMVQVAALAVAAIESYDRRAKVRP